MALPAAGFRIPYNLLDGVTGRAWSNNDPSVTNALTAANIASMADEANNGYQAPYDSSVVALLLPDFDLHGFYFMRARHREGFHGTPEYSLNTTDGQDGTWTAMASWTNHTVNNDVNASFYGFIWTPASPIAGVKGIRVRTTANGATYNIWRAIHIYGLLADDDRLALWHPTTDDPLDGDAFDIVNILRSGQTDVQFRVKNLSTDDAAGVVVGVYADTDDGDPTALSWHNLSVGSGYEKAQPLGVIESGDISGVVTLRRSPPSDAEYGRSAIKLGASVNEWVTP